MCIFSIYIFFFYLWPAMAVFSVYDGFFYILYFTFWLVVNSYIIVV